MTDREALEAGIAWLKRWHAHFPERKIKALIAAAEYGLANMPVSRECQYCGQPIPDTRRSDAKFCSDQHRIDWNSLKRSEAGDAGAKRYAAYLDGL